jgi:hypothetical protein
MCNFMPGWICGAPIYLQVGIGLKDRRWAEILTPSANMYFLLGTSWQTAKTLLALLRRPLMLCAGAIFGLGGALAVYAARHRKLMGSRGDAILQSLGQSLALNLAIGLTTPRIDQWCEFLCTTLLSAHPMFRFQKLPLLWCEAT